MGLFDFLSKEGRDKASLDKAIARAKNKHAQSADRFPALEKLKAMGSDEALLGLAQRFSFTYDKTIEDEQEKNWVYSAFCELGSRGLPALESYMVSAESITWPLRCVESIATPAELLAVADRILEREGPGYTRYPARKLQVIDWLGDLDKVPAAEAARRIAPYLADFDENVRFTAIEAAQRKPDEAAVRGPLIDALVRPEEESKRLKVRIAEALVALGWSVADRKAELEPLLSGDLSDFKIENDRLVLARTQQPQKGR